MQTGWRTFRSTKDGEIYYYNIFTDTQSWNKIVDSNRSEDLVKDWDKVISTTYNQEYWFNKNTGESTWEYPLKPCRKMLSYNTISNDGGGDCLFKSFRDIRNFYKQKPSYTHGQLRQMSSEWLASDDWDRNAINGTEQRARADLVESLRFAIFPPKGVPVILPEIRKTIQKTQKEFNKKYNLPLDKTIDIKPFTLEDKMKSILDSLSTEKPNNMERETYKVKLKTVKNEYAKALVDSNNSLKELQKRYAYALSKPGEYGNTPDITALSWILGVKTCVYKDDPKTSTGSNFGPTYKSGPTYYIINYDSTHFEGLKDVVEEE